MEPYRDPDQHPPPPPPPTQPMPPYAQEFAPPPRESGASQQIPLEGLRLYDNQTPPQHTGPNVPFIDVIPPTAQATSEAPQLPMQRLPAELPSYSMDEEPGPPLPQRSSRADVPSVLPPPPAGPPPQHSGQQKAFANTPSAAGFAPPPQRQRQNFGDDDPSNPIHYTRDPHKLIAYLVPFPTPHLSNAPSSSVPPRFLIYTPPAPPLHKPSAGEKEGLVNKVQRRWQHEVRTAKSSTGVRSKLTRAVSKGMTYTTSSNLDFLGRVNPSSRPSSRSPSPAARNPVDAQTPENTTHQKTVGVEEMILVYPPTMNLSPEQMREEFVNTMLRTKSKATRDSVIATGLLPISFGIDILAGPIGGLGEINSVWAYASIRGAKTARSVTKRLASSAPTEAGEHVDLEKERLTITFRPSPRLEILRNYLNAECNKTDSKLFPAYKTPPTESDVLEAIGWTPHQSGAEVEFVDEQWELTEVKDDLKLVMHKGAKEWKSYCKDFEKDPEKNINK